MSYQAPDPYKPGVANQPPPRVVHDSNPKPPRVTNEPVYEERTQPAKTSAAAAFALVFGVSAIITVLTVVLGPLAIVLALIGIILAIFGIRNAKRVGVTGKGVAIGGLVTSIVALLLGVAMAAGLTFYLNDEQAVERLEQQVQNLRDDLPEDINIPQP